MLTIIIIIILHLYLFKVSSRHFIPFDDWLAFLALESTAELLEQYLPDQVEIICQTMVPGNERSCSDLEV